VINKELLINNWNKIFSEGIPSNKINDNNDIHQLFNDYLNLIVANRTYELREDICLIDKLGYKYNIYFVDNNSMCKIELDVRSKRKFFSLIDNYDIIITKNFPLQDNFRDNKIILRYEVICNILTSNKTHYFSIDTPFPINDYTVFFTKDFYNILLNNPVKFNFIKFSSMLLNKFEIGLTIDDVILKPRINISRYGRWYWSNTKNFQTSLNVRNKLYSKLTRYGNVFNIDFISAEPNLLSKLCNSKLLRKLVKYRVVAKKSNPGVSDAVKDLLNIYIHSNDSPVEAYKKLNKHKQNMVENALGVSVLDILSCLKDDFLDYNNYVIDRYKTSLSIEELIRRIVIPDAFINDREVIKEHRKYLQGHVHDHVLELARLIYEDLNILPLFTIHDSLSYFLPKEYDLDEVKSSLIKNIKKLNIPVEIEVRS